jgi:putative flippase GtrA
MMFNSKELQMGYVKEQESETNVPDRKVMFGIIAGIVGYFLSYIARLIWGFEIPTEFAEAIPVFAALLTAYIVRDGRWIPGVSDES